MTYSDHTPKSGCSFLERLRVMFHGASVVKNIRYGSVRVRLLRLRLRLKKILLLVRVRRFQMVRVQFGSAVKGAVFNSF